MSKAAYNYYITEQELCGLATNIAGFAFLLKKVYFDTMVGHLAVTHIIKSKAVPATIRIKGLSEVLGSPSFNLYYIKEKDMILNDFYLA